MPREFRSQLEVVVAQLQEETAHRPRAFLLRIGRTILKQPAATAEEVLADPVFREYVWGWLLTECQQRLTIAAQAEVDGAAGFDELPDEAPVEDALL